MMCMRVTHTHTRLMAGAEEMEQPTNRELMEKQLDEVICGEYDSVSAEIVPNHITSQPGEDKNILNFEPLLERRQSDVTEIVEIGQSGVVQQPDYDQTGIELEETPVESDDQHTNVPIDTAETPTHLSESGLGLDNVTVESPQQTITSRHTPLPPLSGKKGPPLTSFKRLNDKEPFCVRS